MAAALLCGSLLLGGCRQDTILLSDPPTGGGSGGGGGGGGGGATLRATLTLHVFGDTGDTAVTTPLGWSGGVPDAEVTITRLNANGSSTTLRTDSTGAVRFESVLTGTYTVAVLRVLSPSEKARLPTTEAEVGALGGGGSVVLPDTGADDSVAVAASRQGSLVISEFQFQYIGSLGSYQLSGYLETYNNSDTTIYLDGKIIGDAYAGYRDYPNYGCDRSRVWTLDPRGIRALWFYRFPGTGRRYPLLPRRTAVVATQAIDHSQLVSGGLNLSGADFEMLGSADPDNPSVPNMISVGSYKDYFFGHGLYFTNTDDTPFVADTLDVGALQFDSPPNSSSMERWALIPASKLLDIAVFLSPRDNPAAPICTPPLIDPGYDRQPGRLLDPTFDGRSVHRRVAAATNGRAVLLRTKTTARDFEVGPISPGAVP